MGVGFKGDLKGGERREIDRDVKPTTPRFLSPPLEGLLTIISSNIAPRREQFRRFQVGCSRRGEKKWRGEVLQLWGVFYIYTYRVWVYCYR